MEVPVLLFLHMLNYKHLSCVPALTSLLGFISKRRLLAQSSSVMGPDHRRVSFADLSTVIMYR
jgi:hypothetical protein